MAGLFLDHLAVDRLTDAATAHPIVGFVPDQPSTSAPDYIRLRIATPLFRSVRWRRSQSPTLGHDIWKPGVERDKACSSSSMSSGMSSNNGVVRYRSPVSGSIARITAPGGCLFGDLHRDSKACAS